MNNKGAYAIAGALVLLAILGYMAAMEHNEVLREQTEALAKNNAAEALAYSQGVAFGNCQAIAVNDVRAAALAAQQTAAAAHVTPPLQFKPGIDSTVVV